MAPAVRSIDVGCADDFPRTDRLEQDKKSLKEVAQSNPSQIGDPVSLKAETSDTQPTEQDKPNKAPNKTSERGSEGKKSLKEIAQEKMKTNPSMLGDPVR